MCVTIQQHDNYWNTAKLSLQYCSTILKPWSWFCLYPFFFFTFFAAKKHMKSPQLHHSPLSVLYYKCQEGNLKFIKDTTKSQDVKIGLCYTGMNHRKPHHIALGSVTFTTREKRSWSHQWQVSEIIRSVCSNSWSKTTKQWAMLGRILRWKQVLYKILGHPYLAYGV